MDLPGDASDTGYQGTAGDLNYFGIGHTESMPGADFSRSLYLGQYYFDRLNVGETWSDLTVGDIADWGLVASMYNVNAAGGMGENNWTGSPIYIPFYFTDTTVSATRYGYIDLAVTGTGSIGPSSSLTLTYNGWAYETNGSEIQMGAVPEPSSTALLLGAGAFALVRIFRKKLKTNS